MTHRPQLLPRALWLACLACLAPAAARADRAVVVGINRYPELKDADLRGSVNDARLIEGALTRHGFKVTFLSDAQATRRGILDAIAAARAQVRPDEKFVFYFAGHGTRTREKKAVLLVHDSRQASEIGDLSADDLHAAVKQVNARSRTVLLDSCFSGGMWRSLPGVKALRPNLRTRFHVRDIAGGAKDLFIADANAADTSHSAQGGVAALSASPGAPAGPRADSGVCYFTAAKDNEQAAEDEFNGRFHGVFTHYLASHLGSGMTWGDLQKLVGSKVTEHVQDIQHPFLAPAYVDRLLFENTPVAGAQPAAVPHARKITLWDDFNAERPDPKRLTLAMDPGFTTVRMSEELVFNATAGAEGYLVIVERGTSGRYNLIYPTVASIDAARVNAGKTVRIPDQLKFKNNQPGHEHLKAFLIPSADLAGKLLQAFAADRRVPGDAFRQQLQQIDSVRSPFSTSAILFEVRPDVEVDERPAP
jgi:uncharacterized caspase-like protein